MLSPTSLFRGYTFGAYSDHSQVSPIWMGFLLSLAYLIRKESVGYARLVPTSNSDVQTISKNPGKPGEVLVSIPVPRPFSFCGMNYLPAIHKNAAVSTLAISFCTNLSSEFVLRVDSIRFAYIGTTLWLRKLRVTFVFTCTFTFEGVRV